MKTIQFMKPFEDQPDPGQAVRVFMRDGSVQKAVTCMVYSPKFSGLQWSSVKGRRTGKAIDVNQIKGWLPIPSNHSLEPTAKGTVEI